MSVTNSAIYFYSLNTNNNNNASGSKNGKNTSNKDNNNNNSKDGDISKKVQICKRKITLSEFHNKKRVIFRGAMYACSWLMSKTP